MSLTLWFLFSLKPYKAFKIAQCKQPRLVKPRFSFDINFIFKSTSTARELLKVIFLSSKEQQKAEQTGFA